MLLPGLLHLPAVPSCPPQIESPTSYRSLSQSVAVCHCLPLLLGILTRPFTWSGPRPCRHFCCHSVTSFLLLFCGANSGTGTFLPKVAAVSSLARESVERTRSLSLPNRNLRVSASSVFP
ncbi:hypothetical protein NDU88_004419 [Pleurodeles waltl]|uniref:Secreted protein n=1 Tax=Pleurodeles waltl TaxID=8319 RepID=A0AAV7NKZ4_PLEWA|nr:hypothetical protein NDU88_004419 [Pleurodeles waltl]